MARVAFVTGGTRGIGRAIVERLKADGFKVAAGYSGNEEAAQAVVRDLRHRLYARLQRLSLSWYDRTPAGGIISRLTDDVTAAHLLEEAT